MAKLGIVTSHRGPHSLRHACATHLLADGLSLQQVSEHLGRSEVGTRYGLNLGCLFALEATPTASTLDLVKNLSIKRFTEFGSNHAAYSDLASSALNYHEPDMLQILREQLVKSIDCLDITDYQNEKLKESGKDTVDHVLCCTEQDLIDQIPYVGEKRARRIKNAAEAAVLEYLSG